MDLKDFRENKLKMTQAELAQLIDMRQDAVSRMEQKPETISLEVLQKLAMRTGMTLDQLVNYEKPIPKPLSINNTWKNAGIVKTELLQYIKKYLEANKDINSTEYKTYIDTIESIIKISIKKPKVVFMGRSDAGKSSIINALIGKHKLPTSWSPTSSITVYIKHINDRPSFIEDELWIFKSEEGKEWNDSRLDDEEYCREWKIASGSADMLNNYGIRQGENYEANIGSAVLFIDSDILANCDILDTPGFTGGIESDNAQANKAKSKADVLVYLSPSMGFFNAEDCNNLKEALSYLGVVENYNDKRIPKLANLFIVGSQAHAINGGNLNELKKILDDGCARFYSTITNKFWSDRKNITHLDYSEEDLRERFFSYTTDIEPVRKDFEDKLRETLELLPIIIKEKAIDKIKEHCNEQKPILENIINSFNGLLNERDEYEKLLANIKVNEDDRKAKTEEQRKQIISFISDLKAISKKKFNVEYDKILSDSHICDLIKDKKIKNKKNDIQLLSSFISSEIKDAIDKTLENESTTLKDKINEFISDFSDNCSIKGVNTVFSDFSTDMAAKAFASGLAGAATFGGLALWASACGNLGGYILIAKGVSVLSSLGISLGGTASVISAVSSIGGPVVLGIAIAVMTTLGLFKIFSRNWEKKVAKEIRESYEKQNALQEYYKIIDTFWQDTEKAFSTAADNMENEWQNHIRKLENALNNYDTDKINEHILKVKSVIYFLDNIPL